MRRCGSAALVCAMFAALLASAWAQGPTVRYMHVFVALADNAHQGIVPVAAVLGNGEDAERNLYWGSAYGVKTFFSRSPDWTRVRLPRRKAENRDSGTLRLHPPCGECGSHCGCLSRIGNPEGHRRFSRRRVGRCGDLPQVTIQGTSRPEMRGAANLVAYIGHDGLMDFQLGPLPWKKQEFHPQAIVLACASKQYFGDVLRASGAFPLLWTTNLMAPEAYTLKSALDGCDSRRE